VYVALDEWLALIEDEYLGDFVAAGGAAVKLAVAVPPLDSASVRERLQRAALAYDYHFAFVDAAQTKIHMIDHVFHAVARQLDWDRLTDGQVRDLLAASGFKIPPEPTAFDIPRIAEANAYDEGELRRDVNKCLQQEVLQDYRMARDFRIAMLRLCQARLEPRAERDQEATAIKEWLRGELRLISALKPAYIFQKIARHNARDMFFSLAHWLRRGRQRGLVLVLDIGRYVVARRPREADGSLYHSTAATMDAYEVLRQFIDGTDELEGCLLVVVAPPELLEDDRRGLNRYTALKLRVWDEVHDRRRANPLSALVRLQPGTV
jgi:hypothetical protein